MIEAVLKLYEKTATNIPEDVLEALKNAKSRETNQNANGILLDIIKNCSIAKEKKLPICQDTGIPIFYIEYGDNFSQDELKKIIIEATCIATKSVPLRPNSVDSLNGKNSNDNTGNGIPQIYFTQKKGKDLKISLLLKGGGSENIGKRYSLPDALLNAQRNLNGVRKCVLDAIFQAQGKGCPPEIASVCIGGSKDLISFYAKKQLLENIGRENENTELDGLEKRILKEGNSLGIGPMGLGGENTLLDVKILALHRHPASYFVEVLFSCWALRRNTIRINEMGEIKYEDYKLEYPY